MTAVPRPMDGPGRNLRFWPRREPPPAAARPTLLSGGLAAGSHPSLGGGAGGGIQRVTRGWRRDWTRHGYFLTETPSERSTATSAPLSGSKNLVVTSLQPPRSLMVNRFAGLGKLAPGTETTGR